MKLTIKEYQESDRKLLQSLVEQLMDFVVATDPTKRIRRQDGYGPAATEKLCKTIKKQEGKIYFAVVNGEVAGYIAGFPTTQTKNNLLEVIPTKIGVISDLFVKKKFRNMRIGSTLIAKIEYFLKDKKCDSFWVEVFATNTFAHNYYKSHGFVDREIGMLKEL